MHIMRMHEFVPAHQLQLHDYSCILILKALGMLERILPSRYSYERLSVPEAMMLVRITLGTEGLSLPLRVRLPYTNLSVMIVFS
jgi:hypothetical protein